MRFVEDRLKAVRDIHENEKDEMIRTLFKFVQSKLQDPDSVVGTKIVLPFLVYVLKEFNEFGKFYGQLMFYEDPYFKVRIRLYFVVLSV